MMAGRNQHAAATSQIARVIDSRPPK